MKKGSVYDAIMKYNERQTFPKESGPKRKNEKPEKEVEKDVLDWSKKNNCFLHVVESKAVYSVSAGRYLAGQAEDGYPDLSGNNTDGHSMWVELKAKGKRSNLSVNQYEYLCSKIDQNCFAVVVDSSDILNEFYYSWKNSKNRQAYLKSVLPIPSEIRKQNSRPDPHGLGF